MSSLNQSERESFNTCGYIAVREALTQEQVAACRHEIAEILRKHGIDLEKPETWTRPVFRIGCPESPAFASAGTAPKLWEAYDELIGKEIWWKREGVGGSIPVRFPSNEDPGDAGWHIDAPAIGKNVNIRSRTRGLLALFLFDDVADSDTPTELIAGSHHDVARILKSFGDEGCLPEEVVPALPESTWKRERAFATGKAGDVILCHPFLVHRATWPHTGTRPRVIAQPGVALLDEFKLEPSDSLGLVESHIIDCISGD